MNKDITELYCFIEDFCRIADEKLSEKLLSSGKKKQQEYLKLPRQKYLYQNPLLSEQIRNITNSFNSSAGNINNKITQNIFK